MNFSDILNDYAPYKGIVENLNNTPVSVAGIVESAQGQLIYSLKNENKSSALVVCYSDMEARKLYSDMELYSDNVLYFPTKEYIFYNIETSGHQNEHARISVIQKLVSGSDYIVVTSLDAILQYTCDKEEFKSLCIDFDSCNFGLPLISPACHTPPQNSVPFTVSRAAKATGMC